MLSDWLNCSGTCAGSDPLLDTVKVDGNLLDSGKENVEPASALNQEPALKENENYEENYEAHKEPCDLSQAQLEQFWKQEERRQVEEQARLRREAVEAAQVKKELAALERAAAEKRAAEAAAEAAAFVKAQEEELRLRKLQADTAAEAERARQQTQLQVDLSESEKRKQEERLMRERIMAWCKSNGFSSMNSMKRSFMSGAKFPLHEAVARHNEEMVGLLVQMGADKEAKNSKGQTAEALAKKMNKRGSMDAIIARLL